MRRKRGKTKRKSKSLRLQATERPTTEPCSRCGAAYNVAQSKHPLCGKCRPAPKLNAYRTDGVSDPRGFGSPRRVTSMVQGGLPG